MQSTFREPLSRMRPDPRLDRPELLRERLAVAAQPLAPGDPDRFVHVPAAAGATAARITLQMAGREQLIAGGPATNGRFPGEAVDAPMVDFVSWLEEHFREEDYVVAKLDIEGGEYAIFQQLFRHGRADLIDVLALEAHSWGCEEPQQGCDAWLLQELRDRFRGTVLQERQGYRGWDSSSLPSSYFPVDPRS